MSKTKGKLVPDVRWLEQQDALLEASDVPLRKRPTLALTAWAAENGDNFRTGDIKHAYLAVIHFYEEAYSAIRGVFGIIPFTAAFHWKHRFYEIGPFDFLGAEPDSLGDAMRKLTDVMNGQNLEQRHAKCFRGNWDAIKTNAAAMPHALRMYHDGSDYTAFLLFGREYEFLGKKRTFGPSLKSDTFEYMAAAHAHLESAKMGLLAAVGPAGDTLHVSLLAIEMFLKAYLHEKAGVSVDDLRFKFGHKLNKLLSRVVSTEPTLFSTMLELKPLLDKKAYANDLDDKYKGVARSEIGDKTRFHIYDLAFHLGAFVARNLLSRSGPKAAPDFL